MSAILCAAAACTGSKDKPAEGENQPKVVAKEGNEAQAEADKQKSEAAAKEAKEAEERTKRVAEQMEKDKKAAEEEAARWTDDVRKQVAAMMAAEYKDAKEALTAIAASPHRVPSNTERDQHRHPIETLTFFGIRPDMTVLEVGAGGGWYTEFLAPLVAKAGKLIVPGYDPNGPADSGRTAYGTRYKLFLDKSPEVYGKVEVTYIDPPDKLDLAPEGSVDLAVAIREMHNWHRGDRLEKTVAAIHKALKPGGVFGVVQHRAKPDADPKESAEKGYLPEKWLIETIEAQGFKLVESSDINANPKDTKDYEKGVWTLPPNFAEGDTDKDKYSGIGESDRMTLKFVKPEA